MTVEDVLKLIDLRIKLLNYIFTRTNENSILDVIREFNILKKEIINPNGYLQFLEKEILEQLESEK